MMFKIFVLTITVCVGCLYRVSGASYSKVYVQTGQEVVPLKYVQYGAPALSITSPQIAQLAAAPVDSVVPVVTSPNVIRPCNAPCIYPGSAISSVAHLASGTPNFVTYKSKVPVVVAKSKEPTGYQYSYAVYDEDTGDHKAQHESSDGAVVQGQYSLIQPDGFVREVHYTADDLNGFNAIVKKFLPENVEAKHEQTKNEHPALDCHEVKHESLKSPQHQAKHEESLHVEPHTGGKHGELYIEVSADESHENKHEQSGKNTSSEENHELIEEHSPHHVPNDVHAKLNEAFKEALSESNSEKESSEENSEGHEHTHILIEHENEPHHEHNVESHVEHVAHNVEDHAKHDEHHEISKPTQYETQEGLSYQDIIKCVQKALNSKGQTPGPLTYIILNSSC